MANMRRSIAGRMFGLDHADRLIQGKRLIGRSGVDPMPLAELGDDFLGDVIADQWGVTKGSDAAAVDFAALASGTGGVVRATTGAGAGASMAANGVQLHSFLNWKASSGDLAMTARLKMSAIATIAVFVGFTDQIASLEMPIHASGSGNGLTTNATDAVGFFFDTSMTDDVWWCSGVKADTDATPVSTALAPVADTYQQFRVEVDTAGTATFYIGGRSYGTVANAVTTSVALTPVVAAFRRSAASATIDVDFIHVESGRG